MINYTGWKYICIQRLLYELHSFLRTCAFRLDKSANLPPYSITLLYGTVIIHTV